jgi:hypothetical protein
MHVNLNFYLMVNKVPLTIKFVENFISRRSFERWLLRMSRILNVP